MSENALPIPKKCLTCDYLAGIYDTFTSSFIPHIFHLISNNIVLVALLLAIATIGLLHIKKKNAQISAKQYSQLLTNTVIKSIFVILLLATTSNIVQKFYIPMLDISYDMTTQSIRDNNYSFLSRTKNICNKIESTTSDKITCTVTAIEHALYYNFLPLKLLSETPNSDKNPTIENEEPPIFIFMLYIYLLLIFIFMFLETLIVLGAIFAFTPLLLLSIMIPAFTFPVSLALNRFVIGIFKVFVLAVSIQLMLKFTEIAVTTKQLIGQDTFTFYLGNNEFTADITALGAVVNIILLLIIITMLSRLCKKFTKHILSSLKEVKKNHPASDWLSQLLLPLGDITPNAPQTNLPSPTPANDTTIEDDLTAENTANNNEHTEIEDITPLRSIHDINSAEETPPEHTDVPPQKPKKQMNAAESLLDSYNRNHIKY